tara:strand:- start:728 stop:862 length:135 start_codon:yes stop_codon:yes gene_type:complete
MKPTPENLIAIYTANLAKYVADGDVERARIQREMIANQERKVTK